jgi:chorismate mutase
MNLSEIRQKITSLDTELLHLLNERMEIAKSIAEYKQEHSLSIIDEKREQEILQKIPEAYRGFWDVIMDISKNKQFQTLGNP